MARFAWVGHIHIPQLVKHKRWLSFLATIVVFGTFIVNDALREEAKEMADSIARAQASFAARSEIQAVLIRVVRLNQNINDIEQGLETAGETEMPEVQPNWDVVTANHDYPDYLQSAAILDNVLSVYEALPYDRRLDDQHWTLLADLESEREYINHSKDLEGELNSLSNDREMNKDLQEIAHDKVILTAERMQLQKKFGGGDVKDVRRVPQAVGIFERTVMTRAETDREEAVQRATRWRHLSYFLYPLGLLLGLLGRLSGDKESTVEQSAYRLIPFGRERRVPPFLWFCQI